MNKTKKKLPKFKSENQEREFWLKNSPLDYFDTKSVKKISFPNLKPSLKTISIRLPVDMLNTLKVIANKKDIPYQSLAKIYLAEQIRKEKASLS